MGGDVRNDAVGKAKEMYDLMLARSKFEQGNSEEPQRIDVFLPDGREVQGHHISRDAHGIYAIATYENGTTAVSQSVQLRDGRQGRFQIVKSGEGEHTQFTLKLFDDRGHRLAQLEALPGADNLAWVMGKDNFSREVADIVSAGLDVYPHGDAFQRFFVDYCPSEAAVGAITNGRGDRPQCQAVGPRLRAEYPTQAELDGMKPKP